MPGKNFLFFRMRQVVRLFQRFYIRADFFLHEAGNCPGKGRKDMVPAGRHQGETY